jgi:hypothetical protein
MINELAKLFKERDNKPYMGPVTGIVLSPPPSINVQIGDKIILDNDHLVLASLVMENLINGDEVILVPSRDEQTYYLIDKAVRF